LGVMLSPVAHAIPKTQYKVVSLRGNSQDGALEATLNQMSAEGWTYVGEVRGPLIFKK